MTQTGFFFSVKGSQQEPSRTAVIGGRILLKMDWNMITWSGRNGGDANFLNKVAVIRTDKILFALLE